MKTSKILIGLLLLTGILTYQLRAQEVRSMTMSGNTAFILQELGAVLELNDDKIVVKMIMGASGSAQADADELNQGDEILMIEGKRLNSITELREFYSSLENGSEVRMGIDREGVRKIIRFEKGKIKEGLNITTNTQQGFRFQTGQGGAQDAAKNLSVELGLLFKDAAGKILIDNIITSLLPSQLASAKLEKGNALVSINGKTFKSAEAAVEFINSIKEGENLEMVFDADGKKATVSLPKPAKRQSSFIFGN